VSEAFIGEIRMFGFNFPPRGWATCSGQIMPIAQNTALFSLLGTMYGGNGTTTFALPDLRGRAPLHVGQGPGLSHRTQGEAAGTEVHTLAPGEMPQHSHSMRVATAPSTGTPTGNTLLAAPTTSQLFRSGVVADVTLAPAVVGVGGSLPHENMQPFTVVNFSIAIEGIYPSRN
jgi:microcystin-dependent protein